jgi:uncharacterized protein YacL
MAAGGNVIDIIVLRALMVGLLGGIAYFLQPFALPQPVAASLGVLFGTCIVLLEIRLRSVALQQLIGATAGAVIGGLGALLASLTLSASGVTEGLSLSFVDAAILIVCVYIGTTVGAAKSEMLNLSALGGLLGGEPSRRPSLLLLDTSVIIDGRIADIAETGFLDGTIAIPQFVLRELQLVADSADSLKRNRGRRGLDVLQRLQKMAHLSIRILEDDVPNVREVDMKLIELGKQYGCKVVTNDFNLNKVAQLHGVEVLNINELANALKPVVLPGEIMRVFVLKEGKEYNQGVAYLDDGTMVVVDNARRFISKTIDISVTSVLQTTAGKMIFGRFDERTHAIYDKPHTSDRAERQREQSSAAAPQQ